MLDHDLRLDVHLTLPGEDVPSSPTAGWRRSTAKRPPADAAQSHGCTSAMHAHALSNCSVQYDLGRNDRVVLRCASLISAIPGTGIRTWLSSLGALDGRHDRGRKHGRSSLPTSSAT